MGFLLSFFFGFAPMLLFAGVIYWLDRYEKEPKKLLGGVFMWGAVVAAGAAFLINTMLGAGVYLFTQSESAAELTTGSLIAPIVEETLKGMAVVLVFLFYRREFDSIIDGMVYAGIVALGFAATENVYYIFTYGYQEAGIPGLLNMVFVRVVLVGWQHPFYTAFTGIGLAAARLTRSPWVKLAALPMGWMAAVSTHAIHNTLASLLTGEVGYVLGSIIDWAGWCVMLLFGLYMIARERKLVRQYLLNEVALGNISQKQYQTACSAWSQTGARLSALASSHYRDTARFYQLCGELAHKRNQITLLGEEDGNSGAIVYLQAEIKKLSPDARA